MKLYENYSLKNHNTFRVQSEARFFAEIENLEDLKELQSHSGLKEMKHYFLGNGSNILLRDKLDGLVIFNKMSNYKLIDETKDYVIVEAESGAEWHSFVQWCVSNGYYGLENLALIPGSVGAAPVQNIGAYGVEQREYFHSCDVYDFDSNTFRTFILSECGFDYRFSNFKTTEFEKLFIVKVRYKLPRTFRPNITYKDLHIFFEKKGLKDWHEINALKLFDAICEIRSNKLPNTDKYPNAGSFFKNPIITQKQYDKLIKLFPFINFYRLSDNVYKASAAFLIEKAGWKGKRDGDAGISEMHSLILVNYGNASGEELVQFSQKIIESVIEKFGIELQPEVIIW